MDQKPSIGRIVLYKDLGGAGLEWPAIITRVWTDDERGCVNLRVFSDSEGVVLKTSVNLASDPAGEGGRWRWPPRV